MNGVNKHILLGNLGADPRVSASRTGEKIVTLSLAVNTTWFDKASNEKKERTSWHTVVIFNEGLAGIAEKFLKKGSAVYIEGQSLTRKYQDRDGADRWITETVVPGFGGQLVLLDRAEKAPVPDAGAYDTGAGPAPDPDQF